MSEMLPLPPELQHLIEKRAQTDRRRSGLRRKTARRVADLGPLGSLESAPELDQVALEERRVSGERRKTPDRRKRPRRKSPPPRRS